MNKLVTLLYYRFSIPGLRLVIIVALIFLFTFSIINSNRDDLRSFGELQSELNIYENWAEEKVHLLSTINKLKRHVSMAGSDIYSFEEDNEFFGELFKFCQENRIQIEQWDIKDIKMNPHHVAVILEVGISGKPQSLLQLLHELEQGSNPAAIQTLHIGRNARNRSVNLKSNMEILFK